MLDLNEVLKKLPNDAHNKPDANSGLTNDYIFYILGKYSELKDDLANHKQALENACEKYNDFADHIMGINEMTALHYPPQYFLNQAKEQREGK